MGKNWYVIHTYSGFEGKVKTSLEERIQTAGLSEKFGKIMVPTEEVVEIKEGKKRVSNRKFFPGYVLIEMDINDETWQLVKSTPKVTGFVGGGEKPVPLSEKEVGTLQSQMDSGTAQPRSKVQFQKGENIRIIDGPFIGFNGSVEEVHLDHSKLKVFVSIFGRPTPVELGFLQVEKM
ncbi:MAG: transcription termination/antitermination protein NusG [Nitrospirae bacterium]|nr:transcription termination/antitermination protein NusG [Nitrospirota bacterium]MBI3352143.1 transcription termination/antitermination protein NusG [Nitrospirota bacterium]